MSTPTPERPSRRILTQTDVDPCLRRASAEDAEFLLSLRNDPKMVALSSSQRRVNLDEHQAWLRSMLQSQQNLLLIVMPINGLKQLGYARLDCLSLETATITVVLSPAFQGKGLGVRVIRRVCEMGYAHWQHLHQILAVIRSENLRSLAAFKKAGFTQADQAFQQPDHHVLMIRRSSQPQPSTQHAHCERLEDGR